jgi:hypothetical protein
MVKRGTQENPIVIELEPGFTADDLVKAVMKHFPAIEGLHTSNESFIVMKNVSKNVGVHGSLDTGIKKPNPKAKKGTKKPGGPGK